MKTLDTLGRIKTLMARFIAEVEGSTAMGHTDINKVAENVMVPLLAEVYEWPDLKNLNTQRANFPSVDLGDTKKRVTVQVTSTTDAAKVKHTLEKFVEHKLYQKFDRVLVYVLTRKQGSYSGSGFDDIIGGHFTFDKDKDILDFRDVLARVEELTLDRQKKVESILAANFGDGSATVLSKASEKKTETLHLNLLEMSFPRTLYIADLSADLKKSARAAEQQRAGGDDFRGGPRRRRPKRLPGPRERVLDFLKAQGLRFAVDWEYHAGQIITFHDLEDPRLPLTQAIERETVTTLHPEEFYGLGDAEEGVFRSLLRRCLQQKLYPRGVFWQNEANLLIFGPEEGEELRKEEWVGKKKNPPREVYKMVKKDPDKMKPREDGKPPNPILHHKHLAFETQQLRVGERWYLLIRPDWFFSFDGYRESLYAAENVSWLKRNESNAHVFAQLRFIAYFLRTHKGSTLFKRVHPYHFLSFGQLASLDGAPPLDDTRWLPSEGKLKRQRMSDPDAELPDLFARRATVAIDEDDEGDED